MWLVASQLLPAESWPSETETDADKKSPQYFKKLADFFKAPVVKFTYHMVR